MNVIVVLQKPSTDRATSHQIRNHNKEYPPDVNDQCSRSAMNTNTATTKNINRILRRGVSSIVDDKTQRYTPLRYLHATTNMNRKIAKSFFSSEVPKCGPRHCLLRRATDLLTWTFYKKAHQFYSAVSHKTTSANFKSISQHNVFRIYSSQQI